MELKDPSSDRGPAGRYTLKSAILDQEANKISAKKASFLAKAAPTSGITMSSISMVRRFDPKGVSTEPDDPFHFETGKITPTLSSEIKAAKGSVLSLYVVVYPDKTLTDKPSLIMEFLEDGKPVARVTPDLPAADASGKIAYVASTPSENMKPGQYEVRAIVKQGSTLALETTAFTVE